MKKEKEGSRQKKVNSKDRRYTIRLNDIENDKLLKLIQESGIHSKAEFIRSCIFQKGIKVVKINKDLHDFHVQLTALYAQFRAIGVNYNQVVKQLNTHFTEKKAMAALYKLEVLTVELVELNVKIIQLTNEFEKKWLQKL